MSHQLTSPPSAPEQAPHSGSYVAMIFGRFTEPVSEVGAWLRGNDLSEVTVSPDSSGAVALRAPSQEALSTLHRTITGPARANLNFSLATFSPEQMKLEDCVVLGPVADLQRELLKTFPCKRNSGNAPE